MVKDAYGSNNSTDESIDRFPIIDESLITKESRADANKIPKKYGYDFFINAHIFTAVGDLPLPNDHKIS